MVDGVSGIERKPFRSERIQKIQKSFGWEPQRYKNLLEPKIRKPFGIQKIQKPFWSKRYDIRFDQRYENLLDQNLRKPFGHENMAGSHPQPSPPITHYQPSPPITHNPYVMYVTPSTDTRHIDLLRRILRYLHYIIINTRASNSPMEKWWFRISSSIVLPPRFGVSLWRRRHIKLLWRRPFNLASRVQWQYEHLRIKRLPSSHSMEHR